jgi:hypothetical protein
MSVVIQYLSVKPTQPFSGDFDHLLARAILGKLEVGEVGVVDFLELAVGHPHHAFVEDEVGRRLLAAVTGDEAIGGQRRGRLARVLDGVSHREQELVVHGDHAGEDEALAVVPGQRDGRVGRQGGHEPPLVASVGGGLGAGLGRGSSVGRRAGLERRARLGRSFGLGRGRSLGERPNGVWARNGIGGQTLAGGPAVDDVVGIGRARGRQELHELGAVQRDAVALERQVVEPRALEREGAGERGRLDGDAGDLLIGHGLLNGVGGHGAGFGRIGGGDGFGHLGRAHLGGVGRGRLLGRREDEEPHQDDEEAQRRRQDEVLVLIVHGGSPPEAAPTQPDGETPRRASRRFKTRRGERSSGFTCGDGSQWGWSGHNLKVGTAATRGVLAG